MSVSGINPVQDTNVEDTSFRKSINLFYLQKTFKINFGI